MKVQGVSRRAINRPRACSPEKQNAYPGCNVVFALTVSKNAAGPSRHSQFLWPDHGAPCRAAERAQTGTFGSLLATAAPLEGGRDTGFTDRGNRNRGRPPLIPVGFHSHYVGPGAKTLQRKRGLADRLLIHKRHGARWIGLDGQHSEKLRHLCCSGDGRRRRRASGLCSAGVHHWF